MIISIIHAGQNPAMTEFISISSIINWIPYHIMIRQIIEAMIVRNHSRMRLFLFFNIRGKISIEMCLPRNVVSVAPTNAIQRTPFRINSSTALKPIEKKFRRTTCVKDKITSASIKNTAKPPANFSIIIRNL